MRGCEARKSQLGQRGFLMSELTLFDWSRAVTQEKFDRLCAESKTVQDFLDHLGFPDIEREVISDLSLDQLEIESRIDDGGYSHILMKCKGDLFVKICLITDSEIDRKPMLSKYAQDYDWFLKPRLLHVYSDRFVCVTPYVSVHNIFEHEIKPSDVLRVLRCWKEMLRQGLFYEDWESLNFTLDANSLRIIDIDTKLVTSENFMSSRPDGFLRRRILTAGVTSMLVMLRCSLSKTLKGSYRYTDMMDAETFWEWAACLVDHMDAIEHQAHQAIQF